MALRAQAAASIVVLFASTDALAVSDVSAPAGSPDLVKYNLQSEASMVARVDPVTSQVTLLAAYNDFTRAHSSVEPVPTVAGASMSNDGGLTWTRVPPPIPAFDPACTTHRSQCIAVINGDPWLSTSNGSVLYTALASSSLTSVDADKVIYTRWQPFSSTWTDWQILASDVGADKPSNDQRNGFEIAVWKAGAEHELRISQPALVIFGPPAWTTPQTLAVLDDSPIPGTTLVQNPIIKLASPTLAYLSYQVQLENTSHQCYRVARLTRSNAFASWNRETIYEFCANEISFLPGALGRQARTWDQSGFAIFPLESGGADLWLTFAYINENERQAVGVAHCIDFNNRCKSPSDWTAVAIYDPADRGYENNFMPNITVGGVAGVQRIAVNWYSQKTVNDQTVIRPTGATISSLIFYILGVPVDAVLPLATTDLVDTDYAACPDEGTDGSIGDYSQSVILPVTNAAVTTWTDSRQGCLPTTQIPTFNGTFEQHVAATLW